MATTLRLTCAQARALDRLALDELGVPGIVLMENAGRGAAEHVLALLAERALAPRVGIACGPGNNGGDGFVVARHLANAGVAVALVSTARRESARGDAAIARAIVERDGIRIALLERQEDLASARAALAPCSVLVDALLGTGSSGTPRGSIACAIELLNELGRERSLVALDLPSGLDADRGTAADPTVRADLTVTFAAEKVGFDAPSARAHLGRVVVASIGVSDVWIARAAARAPCAPSPGALR